jgi:hypothetical protein
MMLLLCAPLALVIRRVGRKAAAGQAEATLAD